MTHMPHCHCMMIVAGPKKIMTLAKTMMKMSKICWARVFATRRKWQIAGSSSTLVMPKMAPITEMNLSSFSATKRTMITVIKMKRERMMFTLMYIERDSPGEWKRLEESPFAPALDATSEFTPAEPPV